MNLYSDESECLGPFDFASCGYTTAWMVPLLVGLQALIVNILLVCVYSISTSI
jgi:hypothetical protein